MSREKKAGWLLAGALLTAGSGESREAPATTPEPPTSIRYDGLILQAAQAQRLNPSLVKSIIAAESGFSREAVSVKGARGLMQVLPETAESLGVSRRRLRYPGANLRAGTAYLNWLYRVAWRLYGLRGVPYRDGPAWAHRRVIAAYHGGPAMLGRDHWPPKTSAYVENVWRYYRCPSAALRLPRLG
jgi:soluble lytic murein transglycosylase-like protein